MALYVSAMRKILPQCHRENSCKIFNAYKITIFAGQNGHDKIKQKSD